MTNHSNTEATKLQSNTNNATENAGTDAYEGADWGLTPEDFASGSGESGEKNRPVHKLRFGRLSLAIWQRHPHGGAVGQQEGMSRVRYSVRLSRSYKAADGSYKDTASLDAEDLPTAASLMLLAQQWIITQSTEQQRHASVSEQRASRAEGSGY